MTNKYMYFIANWKMFGDLRSINSLNKVIKFFKIFKKKKFVKIIYCPPNTLIRVQCQKKFKIRLIDIGAQNCHENENMVLLLVHKFKMIKNVGAEYVIIGHSENRNTGETDKLINLKIKSAIKSKLKSNFLYWRNFK